MASPEPGFSKAWLRNGSGRFWFLLRSLCFLLAVMIGITGCLPQFSNQPEQSVEAFSPETVDAPDSSCSYFYFLWGNSAEYEEQYEEALEAYEKALICDPQADYIAEKIPALLIRLGRLKEASVWLENYINDKPDKTVQRFMLARLKIQEGKDDEAIALFQEALDLEPDNTSIRLRLGLLHAKKGETEVAEKIFLKTLKETPNSYFATLYLARLYSQTGKFSEAEQRYREALQLNWSKELSYEFAEFYNREKHYSEAQDIYQEVLRRDMQDERAALGIVQTYIFLKDSEGALKELAKIRTFSNNPQRIDILRAQILINMGNNSRAEKILRDLLENERNSQANYLLGIILYEEKRYDEAIHALEEIPPAASEFNESIMLQVRIFEESLHPEQSIQLLESVIANEQTRLPIFYSILAAIYQRQNSREKAGETLADGVKTYPDDESLLYEYAILQEKFGNHAQAMEMMKKILSLNVNHADALNFIGYSWADQNVKLDKAFEYIRKALDLKPKSGYIQDSLGWVYFRLGNFEKAREALEKAVELEPEDPYIYEHLGDTYRALTNRDKALHYYEKALTIQDDADKIQTLRQKIDELKKK